MEKVVLTVELKKRAWVIVVTAKEIIVVAAEEKTLNSLITFLRNSAIRLLCFNSNSVIDGNLKWAWTVGSNMPISLTFVTLNWKSSSVLVFSVFLVWMFEN